MTPTSHRRHETGASPLRPFLPAGVLTLVLTFALTGARLWPFGQQTVLVRLASADPVAALAAAAGADAVLIDIPAPGYGVLQGDAAVIRSHLGLAILFRGSAPCSPTL